MADEYIDSATDEYCHFVHIVLAEWFAEIKIKMPSKLQVVNSEISQSYAGCLNILK